MNTSNTKLNLDGLPQSFVELLSEHQENIKVIDTQVPLTTAQAAAEFCSVPISAVIKTLLIKSADGMHIAIIMRGSEGIDQKKVRQLLKIKKFRFLTGDEVLNSTSFYPGGVPPLGFPPEIKVCIDSHVLQEPIIIGGGGKPELLIEVTPEYLMSIQSSEVLDLSKSPI